jgi:adenylosuccinate synthase
VVLGLQWGHEGKHKLLNKLCPDYDFSCRFNGGTQYEKTELDNGDELFILPTGIMHDTKVCSVLGNGVVVDSQNLLKDIQTLSNNGIGYKNRLLISDRSNLVTAVHKSIADRIS